MWNAVAEELSPLDQIGVQELLMIVTVLALLTFIPMSVNSRRQRRGEARFHGPLAITMVIVLNIAAIAALLATIDIELPWGIAMSALSLVASWVGLLVMLARGAQPEPAVSARRDAGRPYRPDLSGRADSSQPDHVEPGANGPEFASKPPRPGVSWLEIAAQIAGILSLVISVIALIASR